VWLDRLTSFEAERAVWLDRLTSFEAERAVWLDRLTSFEAERAQWQARLSAFEAERAEWARRRMALEQNVACLQGQLEATQRQLRPYRLLDCLGVVTIGYGWARRFKHRLVS
jgi:septal ring factor EnvC (AmiA/AmiB activator)